MRNNQKLIFLLILFAAFNPISAQEQNSKKQFYSWYNGWGTHTIWGLGKHSSTYNNAKIVCGNKKIQITPIYDTHANPIPPILEQTSLYAETHNIKLIKQLKNEGIICTLIE